MFPLRHGEAVRQTRRLSLSRSLRETAHPEANGLGPLSKVLIAGLNGALSPQARALADLEDTLSSLYESSRGVWPKFRLSEEVFLSHLARHLGGEERLSEALQATRGPDLYLACACARGDKHAIAVLERDFLCDVPSALGRLRLSASQVDEIRQLVREKLLVGRRGAVPKIADYAGRGPLDSWIRVVAVRTALTFLRATRGAPVPTDDRLAERAVAQLATPTADPELDVIRARYAGEFKAAVEEALQKLAAHDRVVLRLHYVDGLNIDRIGAMFRVHRSTVARWIARTKETLLADARRSLMTRLKLTTAEFESLTAAMRSQLHVSIHRFLQREEA